MQTHLKRRVDVYRYLQVLNKVYTDGKLSPTDPYRIHARHGKIISLTGTVKIIEVGDVGRITWSETSDVENDGKISFLKYSYHFQPNVPDLWSFRI